MTLDRETFRGAMAQLGSAVCVVSTNGRAGRYGLTVSAVTSVSDEPPSLIVCVNRRSRANTVMKENAQLCVNVLSCNQEAVSRIFSNPAAGIDERFETGDWQASELGNPQLDASAARFDCRIDHAMDYGTHTVFFCHVADVAFSEDQDCLIYHGRAYHRIYAID